MDQNEMLEAVLSDPAKLQSAIAMASSLLGGAPPQGGQDAPPPQPKAAPGADGRGYDPTADLMGKVLPVMQQIAMSGQNAVSPEKRNLLNAVKPFVSPAVGQQIDHGMRLVLLARVASAVLGQLGQTGGGEGEGHV